MRRVLLLTLAAILCAVAAGARPRWHQLESYTFDQYTRDFKKPYARDHPAFDVRRRAFESNLETIRAHNSDPTRTWHAGVNMFTDMTPAEFKAYNRRRPTPDHLKPLATRVHQAPEATDPPLPKEVDWRTATSPRVLTAVKHQGACGSCWAHSATESMESQYALLTGMLPVLAVAQINSCTPLEYNSAGCDGGSAVGAWMYLANSTVERPTVLKSLTENWAYPMPVQDWFFDDQPTTYKTSQCMDISKEWQTPTTAWFAELTAVGVSGYGAVNSNSATGGAAAQKALRDVGPLSIGVAAGNWQWYETGVFKNTNATGAVNEWNVDHDVQMVGYGYDKVLDLNYWIVRNSWSTLWGEDGFIRLWRAKEGEQEPCSPASFGPVCGTSAAISDMHYPIVYEATPTKFG